MSALRAVKKAYEQAKSRGWSSIYWAIDLHGTLVKSNYTSNSYEWINGDAKETLKLILSLPESHVIFWSSMYSADQIVFLEWLEDQLELSESILKYIKFNANNNVENTATGCFDEKFYMSILIDDKAGFDPELEWAEIYMYLNEERLCLLKSTTQNVSLYYSYDWNKYCDHKLNDSYHRIGCQKITKEIDEELALAIRRNISE